MPDPPPPVATLRGTAGLTIERINPLEHAEAIKQLFLSNERPEFPDFFERAYRARPGDGEGATSWVGWDEHGGLRAHIALFPRQFRFGGRTARGALLANMMVAAGYRTFWPGLALVRQMVKDAKESGTVDFLYADPNEPARALAQVTGFRPVGAMRRFALPLADRRIGVELGIRAYQLIRRLSAGGPALAATEWHGRGGGAPDPPAPTGDQESLRPIRGVALFRGRLAGYPGPGDRWFTFEREGAPGTPVGTALVRGPDDRGVTLVCALDCEPVTLVGPALVVLGSQLRRAGAAKLEISVIPESRLGAQVRRAGFFGRQDYTPLLARSFTDLGAAVVSAAADWRLLPIDLDRGG